MENTPESPSEDSPEGRPWSLAAAMEPLPPLAPPPARPGAGLAVSASRPARRGPGPLAAAASIGLLILAAALILVMVLTIGR